MTRAISSPMTETVIDDADSVSADGGAVSADAGRRSPLRFETGEARLRRRVQRKHGLVVLRIVAERK
jgi:hypothetical protein